ncbi:MAG: AAA family ATPase, partial [Prolixibacteraceae bacterium]|nr:AAA family ATPase [Prolixibacteraceae bacterium]
MIQREAEEELAFLATQFKVVAVTGPRQSGKTTLVRKVFDNKPYANLENPDIRKFAIEDPRGFLSNYPGGAVLDEIQRAPELFSYLQQIVDEQDKHGLFVLTGSNNFLLNDNISQSLAGRVGYLFLLPLTLNEINPESNQSNRLLFTGGYPELHQKKIDPAKYYANYIR